MKLFSIVFALLTACVPMSSQSSYSQPTYSQPTYASAAETPSYGTGIYVNGQMLTAEEKLQLETIIGQSVPAGRYAMDANYNFGYEGSAPVVNLADLARQRQQQRSQYASSPNDTSDKPFSMYSTDSSGAGSSLVSDGNGCMIMSTPSGSLSSGC